MARGRNKGSGDPSAPFKHTLKDLREGLVTQEQLKKENTIYHRWYREKNSQVDYQKEYRLSRKEKFKVYKLVNKDNEVVYIGRTQSDLKLRFQQHCAQYKFNIKNDFNTDQNILAYITLFNRGIDMCDLEIELVAEFNTLKESQAAELACQKLLNV